MLIPFGLGNQVELRYRQAFPHLSSHYAVLTYPRSWGNVFDGIPGACFDTIKSRAAAGARDYLTSVLDIRTVLSSLCDMVNSFSYLHPGNQETLTLNSGSKMEII